MNFKEGKLVILSGPSGSGKSTVVSRLLAQVDLPLRLSISATTREPREGEANGVDYHFMTHDAFREHREAGEFLECKEVFGRGDWYGTLKSEVTSGLQAGKWVLLEIDVAGAASVVDHFPDAITIFLHPGSLEILEERLRQRGTEREEAVRLRLEVARNEMACKERYRHEVVNNTVDATVQDIRNILTNAGE